MKIIFLLLFILLQFKSSFAIDTKAEQAVVIDFLTNEIIFEKNADQKIIPASMTKILTVYVAFDMLNNTDLTIDSVCNISPKAYRMGGSRTFLEIDDKVSINDLLNGIIVQSGNDASLALAECLAGTEEDFAKLMNIYANKIGMNNSNFMNSSGWPEDNHYSTVKDIAILSNSLIKNFPTMYTLFSKKTFTYNEIKQPNRNKLLNNVLGADGLKTGFTRASGWAISASAMRNERRITVSISGTNSSRSRLNESTSLLNWAFTQTSQKTLVNKNQIIKNVDVWLGNKSTVNMIANEDLISILSYDQIKSIESKIEYQKPLDAPIKAGQKIGSLIINISGKPEIILPLVAEKNINKINPFKRIFAAIKYLIFGTSLDEI
ncbi:MAG: D-alanyl-D-alanine carboxypeptidase DacC [Alphaproteobacteria bacterium MarineAlpha5_Bin8]|nr:MAG: D-alanyl-D-alanine carboxypeptidase DacC [Alphaproteobacteria bacterium MarineAlpha5_Bin8]PPR44801.1 MAG: D-alanyl-D-alanine carboxypeptidase DacC [Alphaproteobacteria bacterium MarineAlpha5_Bin7]PPR54505.1 MAG: D-alanyl-D-alanine carboxypeptidase DacC [Alphaproteobacteria bacterium MarineAlpha5_Bin6]|tara:strand:+ start:1035 stop:2165 length:1131 start_codon:yes stop_codon:yes gene_type:complete